MLREYIDKVKRLGFFSGSIIMLLIILTSNIKSNTGDLYFEYQAKAITQYYQEKYK